ncbi:holo-ACP synthase [Calycomorphotria hydatis]|uniref:Holo-[acyl-carrier-protein] synthase n=1 Tax=Calycomorphotria hydatis TaxID=2528027 RepID=A0A517T770_9PLAN|nr:holo-ACP synthase [Calycomorphotria hydatis]QDT64200.1 Holo-[acyl-carrier-protein] synthase [Calycomorphotria hydatis]
MRYDSGMTILGLGTDIVEIDRVSDLLDRHGEHFIDRTFTERERAYCEKHKNCAQNFAGRWAAKEAVAKSLGTGFVKGVGWTEIEIINEKSGAPKVHLSGETKEFAGGLGVTEILVTISHSKAYATATAIAVGE